MGLEAVAAVSNSNSSSTIPNGSTAHPTAQLRCVLTSLSHGSACTCVRLDLSSPIGQLVVGDLEGGVYVWRLPRHLRAWPEQAAGQYNSSGTDADGDGGDVPGGGSGMVWQQPHWIWGTASAATCRQYSPAAGNGASTVDDYDYDYDHNFEDSSIAVNSAVVGRGGLAAAGRAGSANCPTASTSFITQQMQRTAFMHDDESWSATHGYTGAVEVRIERTAALQRMHGTGCLTASQYTGTSSTASASSVQNMTRACTAAEGPELVLKAVHSEWVRDIGVLGPYIVSASKDGIVAVTDMRRGGRLVTQWVLSHGQSATGCTDGDDGTAGPHGPSHGARMGVVNQVHAVAVDAWGCVLGCQDSSIRMHHFTSSGRANE